MQLNYRMESLQKCQNWTGPTGKRNCLISIFSQNHIWMGIIEFMQLLLLLVVVAKK